MPEIGRYNMNIEIKDNLKVAQALALLEYAFDSYNDVHNDDNYFDTELASKAYHYLWESVKMDSKDFDKLLNDAHRDLI